MKKKEIFKRKYNLSKKLNGHLSWQTIKYFVLYRPQSTLFLPFILIKEWLCIFWAGRKALKLRNSLEKKYKLKISAQEAAQIKDLVRVLALYLPQFHRVEENDKWWGEGFTEWTNVRAARPFFEGHNQPRVPHKDIGYYDLSDLNVMRRQAEMARKYGIGGFCFYYYWFKEGRRLLEKPINNYLQAKDIDFPFCFCWANENWTRTWDGGANDVIMPQDHSKENLLAMFKEMLNAFTDERYIKVNARPLFLVYRAELIENIKEIVVEWRKMALAAGLEGVYLVSVQNFKVIDPQIFGFDAALEFAPFYEARNIFAKDVDVSIFGACENVFSYERTVEGMMRRVIPPYKRFRSVFCDWDNSPRRKNLTANLFYNVSVDMFKKHLTYAAKYTIANFDGDERVLLVNAWNEWGEGTYLEPDEKNGYAYLEAVRSVLNEPLRGEL